MKRIFAALATAILVTLATAGCMKLDMNLKVANNDTVSGSVTMAFTKTLMDYVSANGGDTTAFNSKGMFSKQPGVTTKAYSDGEFEGTTYSFASVPLKNFSSNNQNTSLKISREGSNLIVSGELDSSGGSGDLSSAKTNPLTAEFFKNSSVKVAIELPGEIKQTNGVRHGNVITWQGQLGDKLTFQAIAYSPQGLDAVLVSVVGGGIVLVAAAAVLFFVLRKRQPLIGEIAE